MGGERTIGRHDRPSIGQRLGPVVTGIDHRLNRQGHPGTDALTGSPSAEVRNLRGLVHFGANPVTYEFPNDAEPVSFDVALDRVGNITNSISDDSLLDTQIERLTRNAKELFTGSADRGYRHRTGIVPYESPALDNDIQRN
ncbi:MAG: hypothetical protein RIR76_2085 [Verrucomicrobiota bacterium]